MSLTPSRLKNFGNLLHLVGDGVGESFISGLVGELVGEEESEFTLLSTDPNLGILP